MKKGCLYWLVLGWWLEPILYLIKQTRIVVWIAAILVLIGFLIMTGAFLVAMAFIFAALAVLTIVASLIIGLIQKIHPRRACGTDMEDLHAEEFEEQEEQCQSAQAKKQIPTPTKELEMSNEQALRYGSICNAFLEHQEEMEQYEPHERNNEKGNIQDDL